MTRHKPEKKRSAMEGNHSAWFSTWFDSPYYHQLYQHRDENEAHLLIDRLLNELQLPQNARILDLACGKGRHAIYFNTKGFDVTGIDLSPRSIDYANRFSNAKLRFKCCDMMEIVQASYFDLIVNLFTSFGYFDSNSDNLNVLISVRKQLKENGIFILDYINTEYAAKILKSEDVVENNDIRFYIKRRLDENCFIKTITFKEGNDELTFEERVKAYRLQDFRELFKNAALAIKATYGNYLLDPYIESSSPRLILLGQRV